MVQSARMNGHDLHGYLKDVRTRLPKPRESEIVQLLTHQWDASLSCTRRVGWTLTSAGCTQTTALDYITRYRHGLIVASEVELNRQNRGTSYGRWKKDWRTSERDTEQSNQGSEGCPGRSVRKVGRCFCPRALGEGRAR
ncbi:hypothetical protein FQZ97_1178540 [compost metagenome]